VRKMSDGTADTSAPVERRRCLITLNQEARLVGEELLRTMTPHWRSSHWPVAIRMYRKPNRNMLEQALNYIVERHAALRMAFIPAVPSDNVRAAYIQAFRHTRLLAPGLYAGTISPSATISLRERHVTCDDVNRLEDEVDRVMRSWQTSAWRTMPPH
jgi:hypothetical protein